MPSFRRKRKSSNRRRPKTTTTTMAKYRTGPKLSPTPFGESFFTKLKVAIYVQVAPATFYGSFIFSQNSLFDPTVAVGVVQPVGFDELAALYHSYQVYSSKITAKFVTSTAVPVLTGIVNSMDINNLVYSNVAEFEAAPGSQTKLVMGSAASAKIAFLTAKTPVRKTLGLTKAAYQDTIYSADVTASPTEQAYWAVNLIAIDGVTNITGYLMVEVEYMAKFTGRKQLTLS